MFRNSQKISISKHFIIPILLIVLIFTSVGISVDDVCAHDLNESADGIMSELNIEDKLENSQENILNTNVEIDESLGVSQDIEVLAKTITPNGNTFTNIREAVESAKDGDTLYLEGHTYYGDGSEIDLSKSLKIIGQKGTVLDAQGKSRIFYT